MTTGIEHRRASVIARRVPRTEIVTGRAYVIHARNGGVGVATADGYLLRRVKFDQVYLFEEIDWEVDATYGTAIPLLLIEERPPEYTLHPGVGIGEHDLLAWLLVREQQHAAMIKAAWDEVLGYHRRTS
jgi:hypothetical protein